MMKRFAIYGFLGSNMELIFTGLSSLLKGEFNLKGSVSLWMFFVYGLAVVYLEPLYHRIKDFPLLFRGICYCLMIYFIELNLGLFFINVLNIKPWYYEHGLYFLNVIRLDYAPIWAVVGILFEFVYKTLIKLNIGQGKNA